MWMILAASNPVTTTGINWESISVIAAIIATFVLPTIGLALRSATRWTKVEDKLQNVCDDVAKLVLDKERAHREIVENMNRMADYLDKRLRWVEENIWQNKPGGMRK